MYTGQRNICSAYSKNLLENGFLLEKVFLRKFTQLARDTAALETVQVLNAYCMEVGQTEHPSGPWSDWRVQQYNNAGSQTIVFTGLKKGDCDCNRQAENNRLAKQLSCQRLSSVMPSEPAEPFHSLKHGPEGGCPGVTGLVLKL